jgi:hypothetical protein
MDLFDIQDSSAPAALAKGAPSKVMEEYILLRCCSFRGADGRFA